MQPFKNIEHMSLNFDRALGGGVSNGEWTVSQSWKDSEETTTGD